MRKPLFIGNKEYKFKKDAVQYYRNILNSYELGQSLNESDLSDLIDLLNLDYDDNLVELEDLENIDEIELYVEDVKVSKVQFNTKCFEVFYNDNTSQYISYLMIINNTKTTPEKLFYKACRNSVHEQIRQVKQSFFDDNSVKGHVSCQETGILSKWTELVVDHRQPATFSVIVDRFIELNNIDIDKVEYMVDERNFLLFKDEKLANNFRNYHKDKALLRIVRKERNLSRTQQARIKKHGKDLTIN